MSDLHDNFHRIPVEHNDNEAHIQSLRRPCGTCGCDVSECVCHTHQHTPFGPIPHDHGFDHMPPNSGCGCHKPKCECGCKSKKPCGCKSKCGCGTRIKHFPGNTIVIDDANEQAFFYGNVVHENYHQPYNACSPFVSVPTNMLTYTGNSFKHGQDIFEGEQTNNSVVLTNVPSDDFPVMVFKNGLKQIEGDARDYVRVGKRITFNFHTLEETDTVEAMYRYCETKEA